MNFRKKNPKETRNRAHRLITFMKSYELIKFFSKYNNNKLSIELLNVTHDHSNQHLLKQIQCTKILGHKTWLKIKISHLLRIKLCH